MNRKKIISLVLTLIAGLAVCGVWFLSERDGKKSIAVVLTLSHPALDSVAKGFVEAVTARYGNDLAIRFYNAEGQPQQANLIAQKIASDTDVIAILAVGTLAARTVAKAERKRPIVIAAVSDPKALGLNNDNICGLSDAISARYQIDTIRALAPSVKRIALLYSPSEANATSMVENLARVIDEEKLDKILVGIHEPQQMMTAANAACKNADAVLIPLDNQIVASMPTVIKATQRMPCLVIASNESPIHQGAAFAFGIDYQKSGDEAARLMSSIIEKETQPNAVGFIDPTRVSLYVNDKVLREKNFELAPTSKLDIVHIGDMP